MLYRKFAHRIEEFLKDEPKKILLINGARQIANSLVASGIVRSITAESRVIVEKCEKNHTFNAMYGAKVGKQSCKSKHAEKYYTLN